jgi:2-polyprenyl-6-methoxyphenol hydroxylase-like FAD-dependent oxidoreductase
MSKFMYDVVIAGAGPTGLFLTCELQLAGVAVLVLEQMQETRTPLKEDFMGGRGLNLPSVEALYRRGLLPAVRETALGWMEVDEKPGIHKPLIVRTANDMLWQGVELGRDNV